eukprot:TRINITY_DN7144_c0_g1_i7.p1 TRINITY_DN7144_c0_g1~~TRINITY_DN7144_c0_g1_i7.p1  ORF type:complete len:633 (+),score=110.29 TRINITY_DN7144_c0_g1_i7:71-1969(+)
MDADAGSSAVLSARSPSRELYQRHVLRSSENWLTPGSAPAPAAPLLTARSRSKSSRGNDGVAGWRRSDDENALRRSLSPGLFPEHGKGCLGYGTEGAAVGVPRAQSPRRAEAVPMSVRTRIASAFAQLPSEPISCSPRGVLKDLLGEENVGPPSSARRQSPRRSGFAFTGVEAAGAGMDRERCGALKSVSSRSALRASALHDTNGLEAARNDPWRGSCFALPGRKSPRGGGPKQSSRGLWRDLPAYQSSDAALLARTGPEASNDAYEGFMMVRPPVSARSHASTSPRRMLSAPVLPTGAAAGAAADSRDVEVKTAETALLVERTPRDIRAPNGEVSDDAGWQTWRDAAGQRPSPSLRVIKSDGPQRSSEVAAHNLYQRDMTSPRMAECLQREEPPRKETVVDRRRSVPERCCGGPGSEVEGALSTMAHLLQAAEKRLEEWRQMKMTQQRFAGPPPSEAPESARLPAGMRSAMSRSPSPPVPRTRLVAACQSAAGLPLGNGSLPSARGLATPSSSGDVKAEVGGGPGGSEVLVCQGLHPANRAPSRRRDYHCPVRAKSSTQLGRQKQLVGACLHPLVPARETVPAAAETAIVRASKTVGRSSSRVWASQEAAADYMGRRSPSPPGLGWSYDGR